MFATIPNPLIASEHPKLYWTSWGAIPLVPRLVRPPQEVAAYELAGSKLTMSPNRASRPAADALRGTESLDSFFISKVPFESSRSFGSLSVSGLCLQVVLQQGEGVVKLMLLR